MKIEFRAIDLEQHSDLCIQFRLDGFVVSFGTSQPFYEDDGLGDLRYIEWLKSRMAKGFGAFHLWLEGKIIGQLELGKRSDQDDFGYVSFYYLIPEMRGRGLSGQLEDFAMAFLRNLGFKKARLTVSPTNVQAMRFYTKNGWRDLGPRTPDNPRSGGLKFTAHYMEKEIT